MAIHFEGRDVTYAELGARVDRLAAALAVELGVEPGDRVAHLGLNSPDLLELLFACARIGAILVPLNWRLTPAEHAVLLANAEPRALLVELDFVAHVEQIVPRPEGMALVACGAAAPGLPGPAWRQLGALEPRKDPHPRPVCPPPRGGPASPVLIVYTSGTTGTPRGAVLTQEALVHNAWNSIAAHDMTSADHVLTCLPMFHVGGLNIQTTPAVAVGATVTITRRFDPGEVLRLVHSRRPTLLLAVPAVAQALASHPAFATTDLSCLRCLATGSSTVPEAVIRPWLDRGVPVTQVYGMTESGPTAIALSIADAARKVGSCGKPALHTEARLVGADGEDVARGARGEIWLRGPNLTAGYWRNPEATREAFAGGWFKTGDIGHQDEEGFFYIDDRKKDVVISGGENIYPAELENVLADCPAIAEAAVIGRPDPRWGEIPVACVVLKPGASLSREDVLALFRDRLARYKHPRDVVFLDVLPRTAMGKVQKFALRGGLRA
ncbi:MAG: long-chain fatty acid--CoA ligase [Candidatus Rokubacteria bacterium]|nr:long-chain fatty acid--CoA ligase [Candidatus Rokubacteria bacterium]